MHNTLSMEITTFSGEIERKYKISPDIGVPLIEIKANL